MEGAALAEKKRIDVALFAAWHTAVFALNGYAGKLKALPEYMSSDKPANSEKLKNAKLIAGFQSLKARGFDVQISKSIN